MIQWRKLGESQWPKRNGSKHGYTVTEATSHVIAGLTNGITYEVQADTFNQNSSADEDCDDGGVLSNHPVNTKGTPRADAAGPGPQADPAGRASAEPRHSILSHVAQAALNDTLAAAERGPGRFPIAPGVPDGAPAGAELWGAGGYRGLSQEAGGLSWDGGLSGVRLGMETEPRPRLRLGLSAGLWQGSFDWTETLAARRTGGRYEVALTAVQPYAHWTSADGRMRLWGAAGYGSGEVEAEEDGAGARKSDFGAAFAGLGAGRNLLGGSALIPGGETRLRAKG